MRIFTASLLLSLMILTGCTSLKKMVVIMGSNPYEKDPLSANLGRIVYQAHCVSCHGADGTGQGAESASLTKTPANLAELAKSKSAKSFAANIIYGKGTEMPGFRDRLSEKEIWDVANFVKSLASK